MHLLSVSQRPAFIALVSAAFLVASCGQSTTKNSDSLTDTSRKAVTQSANDALTRPIKTMNDIPLEQVQGWSPEQIARLKKSWITTADQVVAVSVTPGGIRSLSEQLQLSEEETRRLVKTAEQALPASKRAELTKPADTSQYGLGANKPEN